MARKTTKEVLVHNFMQICEDAMDKMFPMQRVSAVGLMDDLDFCDRRRPTKSLEELADDILHEINFNDYFVLDRRRLEEDIADVVSKHEWNEKKKKEEANEKKA